MTPFEQFAVSVEPVVRDLAARLAASPTGEEASDALQVKEILRRLSGTDEGMMRATAEGAASAPDGGRAMAEAWFDDAAADVQEAINTAFWTRWDDALGVVTYNCVVGAIHRLGRMPEVGELPAEPALVDVAYGLYSADMT